MKTQKYYNGPINYELSKEDAAWGWFNEQDESDQIEIFNQMRDDVNDDENRIYYFDEFTVNELFSMNPWEAIRAAVCGNVHSFCDDYFYFRNGNIETLSSLDSHFETYKNELVDFILKNKAEDVEEYQQDENEANAVNVGGVDILRGEEGQIIMPNAQTITDYIELRQWPTKEDGTTDAEKYAENHTRIKEACNPQEVYFYEINNHESFYHYDDEEALKTVAAYFGAKAALEIVRIYG